MLKRIFPVALSGAAAVSIQTVIIRECLVLFSGYELVSGFLLFAWLIWNGLGSMISVRMSKRMSNHAIVYAWLLIITSILALFTVVAIRFAPLLFGIRFGYIIGIDKMFLITVVVVGPVCFFNGSLFPVACRILSLPRVYWLEGIGAFTGGLVLTFILIQFLPSFGALIIIAAAVTASAVLLLGNYRLVVIPIMLGAIFFVVKPLEFSTRQAQMRGQDLVEIRESRYGSIAVTRTEGQYNFYTHGFFDFAYPDQYSSEEAVQYAMLLHDHPQKILLIGSGMTGALDNILLHPDVTRILYVELDPELVEMSLKYVDHDWYHDPRVEVRYGDARRILKNSNDRYDVVILNLPEPFNNMLNRYYTVEFFDLVRIRLNAGGCFTLRVSAPVDIIDARHGQMLSSIKRSLEEAFPELLILPASKVLFIGMIHASIKEPVTELFKRNITVRSLDLQYVNPAYLSHTLSAERIAYLNTRIDDFIGRKNYDFTPVCYYYSTLLWSGGGRAVGKIFDAAGQWFIWILVLPVVLILSFVNKSSMILGSIFSVGASSIAAEIGLLILFQIYYGYMYGWIGVLIAAYMLGLSAGAFVFVKYGRRADFIMLSYLHVGIGFLFLLFFMLQGMHLPLETMFPLIMIFLFGLCGGLHFPIAASLLPPGKAGIAYAVDLFGAGAGALAVSVFLIPLFGLAQVTLYFVLFNIIWGFMIYAVKRRF